MKLDDKLTQVRVRTRACVARGELRCAACAPARPPPNAPIPSSPQGAVLRLAVAYGGPQIKPVPLGPLTALIAPDVTDVVVSRTAGRAGASAPRVRLQDPSVSQDHARLVWRGGQWCVVDTDSTNGTFVNYKRVVAEDGKRDKRRGVRGGRRLPSSLLLPHTHTHTTPQAPSPSKKATTCALATSSWRCRWRPS